MNPYELLLVFAMAKEYHDSPATKAAACNTWKTCTCKRAEAIRNVESVTWQKN